MSDMLTPMDQAGQVDELLAKLEGEVNAAHNPHRVALRSLGLTRLGATAKVYGKKAWTVWNDLHAAHPEDLETLHHLAIMHHARAIQTEVGENPPHSDGDWERATQLWHRLWESDEFWERIVASSRAKKRDPIDALRSRFPSIFLQIHFDIAFQEGTKPARSRYHAERARTSPFPEEAWEEVRTTTFERIVETISPAVWQSGPLDSAEIMTATGIITGYLDNDPDYEPALREALRLQVRLVRTLANDLAALDSDDPDGRLTILAELADSGEAWRGRFDRLVAATASQEDVVRVNLGLWYRIMGDVQSAVDEEAAAIAYYEQGLVAAPEGDDNRERCRRGVGESHASLAYQKVEAKEADAKGFCERVSKMEGLTMEAHRVLASAYGHLEEFDTGIEVCNRALELEPEPGDLSEIEALERTRRLVQSLLETLCGARDQRLSNTAYDRALELYSEEQLEEALPLLNRALSLVPDRANALHMRFHTYLGLGQLQEAEADLAAFNAVMGDTADGQRHAADMQEALAQQRETLETFGAEAARLRKQAIAAHNEDDYARATKLLQAAVMVTLPAGTESLQRELAVTLVQRAVEQFHEVAKGKSIPAATARKKLKECTKWLGQATQLDPENERAKENLEALEQAAVSVLEDIEQREKVGEPALELRSKALELLGKGGRKRMRQGIEAFEQAIPLCNRDGRSGLEKELSVILTNEGINVANEASNKKGSLRERDMDEAAKMLERACRLDPWNEHAESQLQVIQEVRAGSRIQSQMEEAGAAYQKSEYKRAEEILRSVLDQVPFNDRPGIEGQLAIVLTQKAVTLVNGCSGLPALLAQSIFKQAREILLEAVTLDRSNSSARENLSTLDSMIN